MGNTYETAIEGIRILPGQWRPHYPWEHIAWISPPWPSQDYVWLDFPETILDDSGLIYLSHTNPPHPCKFPVLPKVEWQTVEGGLSFQRKLPDGAAFTGTVTQRSNNEVALQLTLTNGTDHPMRGIEMRTCMFLRPNKEFGGYTNSNKLAHLGELGWVAFDQIEGLKSQGPYPVHSPALGVSADIPVAVCVSSEAERLVAMTWFKDTLQLGGNPIRPCLHADPRFPDLAPGESAAVNGRVIFFEGNFQDFLSYWRDHENRR